MRKDYLDIFVKIFLPSEIVDRKKSPYPKTHNPYFIWLRLKGMLSEIMKDKDAPINSLLNREYIFRYFSF